MFTQAQRLSRLKELAEEYRVEEKAFLSCQDKMDFEGSQAQLREIHSIAQAMAQNIEALDNPSEEG